MLSHFQNREIEWTFFLGKCRGYYINPLVIFGTRICPTEGQWYTFVLTLDLIQYGNTPYLNQGRLHT